MNPHLRPDPKTPAEVREFVRRVRAAMHRCARGRADAMALARAARPPTICLGRRAAELAHQAELSIPEAARLFSLAPSTVRYWWSKLYPDQRPVALRRRSR